jgi:hypothetical protein
MNACTFALIVLMACASSLPASVGAASVGAGRGERVSPAGEVVVVLSEEFLNSLLQAVASQPEPPSFPLSKGEGGGKCVSQVQLLAESGGTRTSVRFREGRITAPVAFRGAYEAPLVGCLHFEGWADTAFNLEFDPAKQSLNARVSVLELKLHNVPSSLVGPGLTGLVQDAIDARVNPFEILRAEQLGARLPLTRGPEMRLRARDVRHEIVGSELRLHIVYEIVSTE